MSNNDRIRYFGEKLDAAQARADHYNALIAAGQRDSSTYAAAHAAELSVRRIQVDEDNVGRDYDDEGNEVRHINPWGNPYSR